MNVILVLILTLLIQIPAIASLECRSVFAGNAESLTQKYKLTGVKFQYSTHRPPLGKNWWDGWWAYYGQVDVLEKSFGVFGDSIFKQNLPRGYGFQGEVFVDPAWAKDAFKGVDLVHKSYGDRVSDAEKKIVTLLDEQQFDNFYSNNQIGYAGVETNGKLIGFIRVIDGNLGEIPAEGILAYKKISCTYFDKLRSDGYQIYEIGKYSLAPDLNPTELKRVRNELFKWLLDTYMTAPSDLSKSIFIIDPASPIHERAYRKMFGATKIPDDFFNHASTSPDPILTVDGQTLREHLLLIINE